MTRVLVTGATGHTGAPLVERLRASGASVRTASRTPVQPVQDHVRFDWFNEETHAAALDGVDRAYLLGPPGVADVDAILIPFLRRAEEAGVRRFVLLSASAIAEGAPGLGRVHAWLSESAPEWTVLQPSWFLQNFVDPAHLHGKGLRDGRLVTATGDGRVGFVDTRDIAEVASRALLDPKAHNTAHVLTGPEAISYDEVARRYAAATERDVLHEVVSTDALAVRFTESGMPDNYARILAALDDDIRLGHHALTTDTVERVTGRIPGSLDALLAETADGLT